MARESKSENPFTNPLDREIYEAHRRYVAVMEARLPTISDESKGHYTKILQSLADKLAVPGKPLSEIVSEMMSEAAPLLFQTMQR
jgi:hypothetical protein